jgi:hypothetical protein
MSTTIECQLLRRPRHDSHVIRAPAARVPRLARLMALAIRFEELLHLGEVHDYAELARLGRVSRALITQIMNLCLLAPDIQEEILFLAQCKRGRDPIHLALVQPVALEPDWRRQRQRWAALLRQRGGGRE